MKYYSIKVKNLSDFNNNKYVVGTPSGALEVSSLDFSTSTSLGNLLFPITIKGNAINLLTSTLKLNGNSVNTNGGLVSLDANGKLADSMIPSIALSEYLGQYSSWDAAESAVGSSTGSGDTISIADDSNSSSTYSMYICVNTSATPYSNKFVVLKSSAQVVTQGEFQAYQITVTSELNGKQDKLTNYTALSTSKIYKVTTNTLGQVISGSEVTKSDLTSIIGDVSSSGSTSGLMTPAQATKLNGIENNANNYSLPTASSNILGGVKIGDNINITDGVISVASNKWSSITLNKSSFSSGYYQLTGVLEIECYENGEWIFPKNIVKDTTNNNTKIYMPYNDLSSSYSMKVFYRSQNF